MPYIEGNEGYYEYQSKIESYFIQPYETIKIRRLLSEIFNPSEQYPIRENFHVDYYSGLALWIPDQWEIVDKDTRDYWSKYPSERWVNVEIWKIDQFDGATDAMQYNLNHGLFFGAVGAVGDNVLIYNIVNSKRTWPIFRNMLFYNTIKDEIVWANWDLVSQVLLRWVNNKVRTRFYEIKRNDNLNIDLNIIYGGNGYYDDFED